MVRAGAALYPTDQFLGYLRLSLFASGLIGVEGNQERASNLGCAGSINLSSTQFNYFLHGVRFAKH